VKSKGETVRAADRIQESSPSDEMLMNAYLHGDRAAFDQLYGRLGPRVHGFFLRAFGSRAVADDLLQTTFLKFHRARRQWHDDKKLRPWLFSIAARVRLDELRRRYGLREDSGSEAVEAAAEAQVPPTTIDPAEVADVKERVQAALARLPESQRVVVHLHRFEGLTFKEIGEILGTTEGAVKLRAFRAYGELRDLLGDFL
jgi:RNA polymerase sigma-70 factor, ECF subfamily